VRGIAVAIALILLGCQRAEPFTYPAAGAARSMIVVVSPGERAQVYDLAEGMPDGPLIIGGEAPRISVLFYDDPPSALGFDGPGPIEPPTGPGSRALPVPNEAHARWLVSEADFSPLIDPELEALREAIQVAGFDVEACLEERRCVRDVEPSECRDDCEASVLTPPLPPEPACPSEWMIDPVAGVGGVTTCRPRDPPRLDCTEVQVQHRGSEGCAPIGPACAGHYASDLPVGAIHVDPTAPAGGDGTEASPLRMIAEALAIAAPGTTIALSEGTHLGPARVATPDLTLIGACAGRSSVAATSTPALTLAADGVTLRGLSIAPAIAPPGSRADHPAIVSEADVALDGVASGAILVAGGRLVARDVKIEGVGHHLASVRLGAQLEIDRLMIRASGQVGLFVEGGAVDGERLVIQGGESAINARGPFSLALSEVTIDRPEIVAMVLTANEFGGDDPIADCQRGADVASAAITGLTVIGSGDPGGAQVGGVQLACKASLELERAYFAGLTGNTLLAGPLATFTLRDLVVRDVASSAGYTVAIDAEGGTYATIERAYLESHATKVLVSDDRDTAVTYADVAIDARGESDDAVHLRDGFIRLKRILAEGTGRFTVRTKEPLVIEDLRRIGARDVTAIEAQGTSMLRRIDLSATESASDVLQLASCGAGECVGGGFMVSDLHVRGGQSGLSTGVVLATTRIDRFLFEAHQLAALRLPTAQPLVLRDGTIKDSGAVLASGSGDYRLLQLLDGVVVEGNDAVRIQVSP
jgi:hypothetical protein